MSEDQIAKLSKEMRDGFKTVNNRFDKVDKRFDRVDKRFEVNDKHSTIIDSQLDRLTKLAITGFDRIDKALETRSSTEDIQKVYTTLDNLSKRQEISDDERMVMTYQLTRLHEWVEQAAKRIDLKFVR